VLPVLCGVPLFAAALHYQQKTLLCGGLSKQSYKLTPPHIVF
jgi:hypothetical protein